METVIIAAMAKRILTPVARDGDRVGRVGNAGRCRVDRWHVHDTTPTAARQRHGLHRYRIHAAHRLVQDDAAEDLDARDALGDQIGPRSGSVWCSFNTIPRIP